MEKHTHVIKVNLPGGIISAGDLYTVLEAAEEAGVEYVQFGHRQQLFFTVRKAVLDLLKEKFAATSIPYEVDGDEYPNIISSYVAEEVFHSANWLREGVYKDILDLFDYSPRLKINLAGNTQSFVPFFNGNLNFITSNISNYWFLYIRFPKTNISYSWPVLVYSEDIPALSKLLEKEIWTNKDLFYDQKKINGQLLYTIVNAKRTFITEPVTEPLDLPVFQLPYYEGFNRYGNKLWLGIYRRNERFSLDFLKEVATICLQTRAGQLYTTPWKSIIIKGISEEDRSLWDNVLAKHRINVRHASNELNWQLEDLCEEGLKLKHHLVRAFDDVDLRTYRLCFAIKTKPKTGLFGSVVIRKQFENTEGDKNRKELYDLLYTRDFNPNSKDFIVYKKGVEQGSLFMHISALCDLFYASKINPAGSTLPEPLGSAAAGSTGKVYQCKHCLTIYDEAYGEEAQNIPPGIPFEQLGASYVCPICEAPKNDFLPVERSELDLL